jgi:hypothetical protein
LNTASVSLSRLCGDVATREAAQDFLAPIRKATALGQCIGAKDKAIGHSKRPRADPVSSISRNGWRGKTK